MCGCSLAFFWARGLTRDVKGGVPHRSEGKARGYNDKRGAGLPSERFESEHWIASGGRPSRTSGAVKVWGNSRNPLLEGEEVARPSKSYAHTKVWGAGRNPIVDGDPNYAPSRAPTRGYKFLQEGTSSEYDLYPRAGSSGSAGRRHVVDPNRHTGSVSLASIGVTAAEIAAEEERAAALSARKGAGTYRPEDTQGLIGGINAPTTIDQDYAAEASKHEQDLASASVSSVYEENRAVYRSLRSANTATNPALTSFAYPE